MPERYEIRIPRELCQSCSMALGRFLGKLKGIESVSPEEGKVVITYDEKEISEEDLKRISSESLEKLGHHV